MKYASESNTFISNMVANSPYGLIKRVQNKISLFLVQYVKHETMSNVTTCIPYKLCPLKTMSYTKCNERGKYQQKKEVGLQKTKIYVTNVIRVFKKNVLINHYSPKIKTTW